MSKSITITDGDTSYTLEFSRDTVRRLEQSGFILSEVFDKPMTGIPTLFRGALLLHHPHISDRNAEELYKKIPRKMEFIEALTVLYNETLNTLMDEPDKKSGEAKWKMN